MPRPTPRDAAQVQFAHDVIHAIVAREIDLGLAEEDIFKFNLAHDVLSWVLGGPCGSTFNTILLEAVREAKRRGYTLERVQ